MRDNPIKKRLAGGETVFGTMAFEFASPGLAPVVANAGADFILLDMEHSGWSFETIKSRIALAHGAGLAPFVNPPGDEFSLITRCLDLGAFGVMVPVVESRAQAEAIVQATRYPPLGRRGSAFGVAHTEYRSENVPALIAAADARTMVIVKIETAKGVANADEIMAVPGVDVGFVGHTDLSVSLGRPADFDHPGFIAARDSVLAACQRHGKAAGCLVPSPEAGRAWIARGFRFVAYLGDIWLLGGALRSGIESMKRN
jgi:2-keto-3-deoxy-L-rhamnonate aldolase RhmA